MRLVRVQVTNKQGRYRVLGIFRSRTGRRIRRMLGSDVRKDEMIELMQIATGSADNTPKLPLSGGM